MITDMQADFERLWMMDTQAPERVVIGTIDRMFFRGCGCLFMPGNAVTLPNGTVSTVTRVETVTGGNLVHFEPRPFALGRPAQQ